jgi:kinesin family protein 2/24
MELVRKEVNLVAEMDQPGSAVDTHRTCTGPVRAEPRRDPAAQGGAGIAALQAKVAQFQGYLREEEILAQTVHRH